MPDNRTIEIKIAMLQQKVSQAQIARELAKRDGKRMSKATVNQVINGHCKSKRVSDYLAERLKIAV